MSRTQAARIVAAGDVKVGGVAARASRLLQRGDVVVIELSDAAPPRTIAPYPVPLAVCFEDEYLAVIDKAAGMVVHPVQIGLIAPPVGLNVYVINGMAKDVPMAESYRGVMPFLVTDFIRTGLLVVFPSLSLWLVKFMN